MERHYKVIRVPLLFSPSRTMDPNDSILGSYNNCLIDPVQRKAVIPAYGIAELDSAAKEVFVSQGFKVLQLDSRRSLFDKGSFHCNYLEMRSR